MISILIPVYNFDIRKLVNKLNEQAKNAATNFEILIIDDLSAQEYKQTNSELNDLRNVRYLEWKKKLGRSKIRNTLAEMARYEYLLFMDCDSQVNSADYIQNYLPFCKGRRVVCGGRVYQPAPPEDPNKYLRWLYGTKREVVPADKRNETPNQSFMTNNFLISKSIFKNLQFDESITNYGHEDTLFGYELKKQRIFIQHIDNPLVHIDLETADEFIEKTRQGIRNLKMILDKHPNSNDLIQDVKLLKAFDKVKKWKAIALMKIYFSLFEKRLTKKLTSEHPSLKIFDIYKLAYLCTIY